MIPVLLAPPAPLATVMAALERPDPARAEARTRRRQLRHPDDPALRLDRVWTLLLAHPGDSSWCETATALLEPIEGADWVPWREATRMAALPTCQTEAWPDADAARAGLREADWAGALQAAIEVGPAGARVRADLLEAHAAHAFGSGDHERAVLDLREAIALRPTPDRRLRLGLSLMPLGYDDEARAQLSVGLMLGGTHPVLADRARMALSVLGGPQDGNPEALIERAEGTWIDAL